MDPGNSAVAMVYLLVGLLVLVVAGVVRLWTGRRLTRKQWDKIGTRVEVGVALGLVSLATAVTFYYHFAK